MKIALVILHADPARGGAERYTIDLAAALAARGHDVALLACSFHAAPQQVEPVILDAPGLTRARRYGRFLDSLDLYLSQNTYDVLHAMLPVRECDIYHPHAGIAAQAIRTGHLKHASPIRRALAQVFNRFNPRRARFARVERELLGSARPPTVLCLSNYIQGEVRRHYPSLAADRLATLFNAVDLARFNPQNHSDARQRIARQFDLPEDSTIALMIAQDFARKGLGEALEAMRRIADPRLALLVAGKENPAPWRRMAQRLGVSGRVLFAGPTPQPELFYAAADFFCLPTHHDPCSLVVLEALAMGLPVLSTRQNGACEIMTDTVHGRILDSASDIDAMVRALRDLIDPGARGRMRQACLDLRPRLAHEAHVDRLLEIYRDVLARRQARPNPALSS